MSQKKQWKWKADIPHPGESSFGVPFSLVGRSLAAEAPGSIRQARQSNSLQIAQELRQSFPNHPSIMTLAEWHNLAGNPSPALLQNRTLEDFLKFMGGLRLVKLKSPDLGFGHPENMWGEDIPTWDWALFCCPGV